MTFIRYCAIACAVTFAIPAMGEFKRDPIGEEAEYVLDRDPRRTSPVVRSGNLFSVVTRYNPDGEDGPVYEVEVDYEAQVHLIGDYAGAETVEIPEHYFSDDFLEELRTNGEYEDEQFKMRHLGYGDASDAAFNLYRNCDKVLIYDVSGIAEIQNLEIRAHITDSVPVLGAVKVDISGTYMGMFIKAGGNYIDR